MLRSELDRLRVIHNEIHEIYEEQSKLVEGLGIMLEELDIGEAQNLIE